jgi:hypothetical protein
LLVDKNQVKILVDSSFGEVTVRSKLTYLNFEHSLNATAALQSKMHGHMNVYLLNKLFMYVTYLLSATQLNFYI